MTVDKLWNRASKEQRIRLLTYAKMDRCNAARCKSLLLNWNNVNPIVKRRLKLYIDNTVG